MAERLNVNPTRMELSKLKIRLKTAVRGHKLLKDKSDEMIRQFMIYIKENKKLREDIESQMSKVVNDFIIAQTFISREEIEEAFIMPAKDFKLNLSSKNIMSVNVPKIDILETSGKELIPYSILSTSSELDAVVSKMNEMSSKLIQLAEVEKICDMLALEIERNRRRVNALEYVLIPQTKETIKYISMKLDENERANIVRLMKIKDIIDK